MASRAIAYPALAPIAMPRPIRFVSYGCGRRRGTGTTGSRSAVRVPAGASFSVARRAPKVLVQADLELDLGDVDHAREFGSIAQDVLGLGLAIRTVDAPFVDVWLSRAATP